MVGHQNNTYDGECDTTSLGRQGMVGHQNRHANATRHASSLGRQGMVGHQNWAEFTDKLGSQFRPSGNGRPPKQQVDNRVGVAEFRPSGNGRPPKLD